MILLCINDINEMNKMIMKMKIWNSNEIMKY